MKQSFRPEFLNRLDEIVFYKPLTKKDVVQIVDLLVKGLEKRLEDRQLHLTITPKAKELIADLGYDPMYGARPLKRFMQSKVESLIARKILSDDPGAGDTIEVGVDNEGFKVSVVKAE